MTNVLWPFASKDILQRLTFVRKETGKSDEADNAAGSLLFLSLLLAKLANRFSGNEGAVTVTKNDNVVAIAAQIKHQLVDEAAVIVEARSAVALMMSRQKLRASDRVPKRGQLVDELRIVSRSMPCVMNQHDHWEKLGKVLNKAHVRSAKAFSD